MLRLGLIGDNIKRSKSPLLHRLAGQLCGLEVTYESLIPADIELEFDAVFERCMREGFRGINITYPYKEKVFDRLRIEDNRVRAIRACNTVIFGDETPAGMNTDYTGFVSAFRENFAGTAPGIVAMAGAGGVGKAIAFGLADLGARELRLYDRDQPRAEALADALRSAGEGMRITVADSIEDACGGSDGLVNCTPLGMNGIAGTAIPAPLMSGCSWAFDAVYTPADTQFLKDAQASGLQIMSGYELFFYQGVHAFHAFTGENVDTKALRAALVADDTRHAA